MTLHHRNLWPTLFWVAATYALVYLLFAALCGAAAIDFDYPQIFAGTPFVSASGAFVACAIVIAKGLKKPGA